MLRTLFAALAALPILATSDLPPQYLPVLGGSGGNAFSRDCGTGRVLTGVRYRSGMFIDAIGLQCRPVLSDGSLGPESTVGTLVGGGGGSTGAASCPSGQVVTALRVLYGSYTGDMLVTCQPWHAGTRSFSKTGDYAFNVGTIFTPGLTDASEACESTKQPGSGLRGRAAVYVDAIGLVCDEP